MTDNGRKPGPATREGKAAISAAATRHGAWRLLGKGLIPLRRGCPLKPCRCADVGPSSVCPVLLRFRRERMAAIVALPWIRPEHQDLVREFVTDVVALAAIDAFTVRAGMFRVEGDLDLRGILTRRWTIANAMARLADRLGLTPAAMRELKLDEPIDVNPLDAIRRKVALIPSDGAEGEGGGDG